MKILLATDGTKHGKAAAEMLTRYNLKSGDKVHVINVVDMALPVSIDLYGGYLPDMREMEKAAKENAASVVTETSDLLSARFPEAEITTDIVFGSPDSRIVETAEEISAELIVLGSHGYSRWERLLLGSVSSSVVHHAHCSVLIVRTAEKADA